MEGKGDEIYLNAACKVKVEWLIELCNAANIVLIWFSFLYIRNVCAPLHKR